MSWANAQILLTRDSSVSRANAWILLRKIFLGRVSLHVAPATHTPPPPLTPTAPPPPRQRPPDALRAGAMPHPPLRKMGSHPSPRACVRFPTTPPPLFFLSRARSWIGQWLGCQPRWRRTTFSPPLRRRPPTTTSLPQPLSRYEFTSPPPLYS
jgi:hypothetical protein